MINRLWIGLKRFRYRRGYGVHSPFAFDFLTYVVYERGEYYAYEELKKRFPYSSGQGRSRAVKCRKFLFRLANYVHPQTIRLYGGVEESWEAYLSAGFPSARIFRDNETDEREQGDGKTAFCELRVVGGLTPAEEWAGIASGLPPGRSVCVLTGIHVSDAAAAQWEAVKQLPSVIVSFDLYDYGLLFYDVSKQRQHYIVNF
ncbi:MAG: hypothetical protein LUC45_09645 [Paraprevotella sp.]|nr:hypothetical protein [Paraprevotella sp.]